MVMARRVTHQAVVGGAAGVGYGAAGIAVFAAWLTGA